MTKFILHFHFWTTIKYFHFFFEIINQSLHQINCGMGVKIKIENTNRTVHIWNLHLDYRLVFKAVHLFLQLPHINKEAN